MGRGELDGEFSSPGVGEGDRVDSLGTGFLRSSMIARTISLT